MTRPQKLLTPGPTSVPPEVLRALAEPVLHHRSPDFAAVFEVAQERLREVFRTENEVLVFTSSGTGAFESAIVNLLSPGERVLAVSQGEFGERWQAMAARLRLRRRPARLRVGRGAAPRRPPEGARRERRRTVVPRPLRDVDRGRVRPRAAARGRAREAGALSIVDAVSSLGAVPLETDAWGADVVVTGSQKALMTPSGPRVRRGLRARPGSGARRRRCRASTGTGRASAARRRSARPRSRRRRRLVVALVEALGLVLEDGLEAAFARHRALGRALPGRRQGDRAGALLAGRRQRGRAHRRV